ncbi:MAG: DNA polymerase III subunit beta [Syntrophomonadaceae bacterium]|jgi:DNA polymerase-3 subunit beta|nr:DNA polymerase III subunit beta [Syntrophomonadaceae bacterium]
MKFSVNKNLLSQAASIVQRAASTKDTIPALSGMLITAEKDRLILQGTDLDIGIKKIIFPADIVSEGSALVNAKYFSDLVRYLSEEEVTISLDETNNKLNVYNGFSSSYLNLYNPDDFPEMPLNKVTHISTIPQLVLKNFIRKTVIAAAVTHFKPVFTGILFDFSGDSLTMVASDTHRLAVIRSEQIKSEQLPGQYIIPVRIMSDIARILEDGDSEINIGLAENHIVFYTTEQDLSCSSRLIEGQYPNYIQVIPKNFVNTFLVNSSLLTQSLERTSLMPFDQKMIQYVKMNFEPEQLVISAFSEKMGEMTEIIKEVEAESKQAVELNFNTRYLLDAVKLLSQENKNIQISLSGPLGPAVIRNPEDDNYTYVLVPLRTG